MQKPIECYRLTTVGPDMVTINNEHAFVTYIVVFAKPKTQAEALQLFCSKQWKKAIDIEYNNLVCNSVIKWVDKLPEDKHAITEKVVYKKRENENGDFLKCYTYIVVRGFLQIPSEDFTKTFILVAKFAILHVYLALITYLD